MTVHLTPSGDSGIMPCCNKTPFEARFWDRLTNDSEIVTCGELKDILTSPQCLADELKISYRQINYWIRRGYITPESGGGSGNPHFIASREVEVARLITRLLAAGIVVETAATTARYMIDNNETSVTLPGNVIVVVLPERNPYGSASNQEGSVQQKNLEGRNSGNLRSPADC